MGKGMIWALHLFSLKAPMSWDPSELVRLLSVHLILIAFGIQACRSLAWTLAMETPCGRSHLSL